MRFEDRAAVVTGGARGIGLACAARIAAGGGRIALWDRDMDRAKQSAASLGDAIAVPVDVTDDRSIAEALAKTEKDLAAPDILVASADGGPRGYLENLRHGHFRWTPAPEGFAAWADASWLDIVESDGNVSWDLVLSGNKGTQLLLTATAPPVITTGSPSSVVKSRMRSAVATTRRPPTMENEVRGPANERDRSAPPSRSP